METMRAAVVRNFGAPLAIEERPVPTPGPGERLVRDVARRREVRTRVETQPLAAINHVSQRLETGTVDGRVVLTL